MQPTLFGEDAYPDFWTKAAASAHQVANGQALVGGNGNKVGTCRTIASHAAGRFMARSEHPRGRIWRMSW